MSVDFEREERQLGLVYTWLLYAFCRIGYPSDLLLLATKNRYNSDLELGLPHYHVKEINSALHFIHHQPITRSKIATGESGISRPGVKVGLSPPYDVLKPALIHANVTIATVLSGAGLHRNYPNTKIC